MAICGQGIQVSIITAVKNTYWKLYNLELGEPSDKFFGQTWDFGPTGLTPLPLPKRWDTNHKIFF